ncbi:hypothetical protein [Maricaulis sp.]|uniref:hypothetical protein n=1 Tax=Maricaulis sp. TaxID=1486257 RepID=UPI003A8F23E2
MSNDDFKSLLEIMAQEHFRTYLDDRNGIDARMAKDGAFYSSARFNAYHQLILDSIDLYGIVVRAKLVQVGALQFNTRLLGKQSEAALVGFVSTLKADYEARCVHTESKKGVRVPLDEEPIALALERQIRELGYAEKEASNSGGFLHSLRNLPSELLRLSATRIFDWLLGLLLGGFLATNGRAILAWAGAHFG